MDSHTQPDYNMVSQLALRVALQTMKERCLSLQQRLSVVEEENQSLRGHLESDQRYHDSYLKNKGLPHCNVELNNLRSQVSELGRQKVQLSDHINMVANENRKLWSRLSQIAKEQQDTAVNQSKENKSSAPNSPGDELGSPRGASQNLIRSRTFTQHSPNPNLRLKVINFENMEKDVEDPSLEEVLLVEASDDDESGNRELKSDDMIDVCETELGFSYLNLHASIDDEFNIEAKKCLEGLQVIRLEALQQQIDITTTVSTLENRFVLQGCSECAENARKPEMVDKSLETDDSVAELSRYMPKVTEIKEIPSSEQHGQASGRVDFSHRRLEPDAEGKPTGHIDFIQRKLEADDEDKVCPMCGDIFNSSVTFDAFRGHVESHFIDDSITDSPIEHNFELISHTVGDF